MPAAGAEAAGACGSHWGAHDAWASEVAAAAAAKAAEAAAEAEAEAEAVAAEARAGLTAQELQAALALAWPARAPIEAALHAFHSASASTRADSIGFVVSALRSMAGPPPPLPPTMATLTEGGQWLERPWPTAGAPLTITRTASIAAVRRMLRGLGAPSPGGSAPLPRPLLDALRNGLLAVVSAGRLATAEGLAEFMASPLGRAAAAET